jgi:hypothetical protein
MADIEENARRKAAGKKEIPLSPAIRLKSLLYFGGWKTFTRP